MENIILSFVLLRPFTWIISLDGHLSPIKYMAYHFKHLKEEEKNIFETQRFFNSLKVGKQPKTAHLATQ